MALTEADRRLLATLADEPRDPDALADAVETSPTAIAERIDVLVDNGLVAVEGERYRPTESGRRLLRTAGGRTNEAVDTDPAVERAIASRDHGPAIADAVRAAYAFVRYWGEATVDEVVDAIYPEWPADVADPDEWWVIVAESLAAIPDVEPPATDAPLPTWRYRGTPEVTTPDADGFLPSTRRGHHTYGSVKHAIESLDLSADDRDALRVAFGELRRRGTASERDLVDAVRATGPEWDAEKRWSDHLGRAISALPGVDHLDGDRWRYDAPPAE